MLKKKSCASYDHIGAAYVKAEKSSWTKKKKKMRKINFGLIRSLNRVANYEACLATAWSSDHMCMSS